MGNHLIVADEEYDEFKSIARQCEKDYEYYGVWYDVAKKILGVMITNRNDFQQGV